MTSDAYRHARTVAQTKLYRFPDKDGSSFTRQTIQDVVDETLKFLEIVDVSPADLAADLERTFQTIIGDERALVGEDDGYQRWLSGRKSEIEWAFWRRYEQHLVEEAWAPATLRKLDETTDHVLGLLTAPDRPGPWDRRGMVVGDVQSGKTSHYAGLICKAADAGYKVLVVLSGFHKSLRSQTQIRLEEGFLGYDKAATDLSNERVSVGVGRIDSSPIADSITTRADNGDFKRQVAQNFGINPGGHPLLFVIKKNGSVLRNLLGWVRSVARARDEHGRPYVVDVPLLVIDDEADQGSVDTRDGAITVGGVIDEDHDPTVLNRHIRSLLHLFDRSAYVGYTATPFANIFIHELARTSDCGVDLFPRSFILSLPTPSNYVGPSRIFGTEDEDGDDVPGIPITRTIVNTASNRELNEIRDWMPPKHRKDHRPEVDGRFELPASLRRAVRSFVLATSARRVRGAENSHNSMLVHVTRFTIVQGHVAEQLREEIAGLRRRLRYGDGGGTSVREELRELWENDFVPTTRAVDQDDCPPIAWRDVESNLERIVESLQVREFNGSAGDVLDYYANTDQGLNVIAVGGDKLSRGLTLEGLTVSYFLRASRMYDTLMQMGRWFGYRPAYLDLCRLYSTPELVEWFGHIAAASDELRDDFNRMSASGGTPRDFGLRVRCHPLMMVTSRVKRRHGQTIRVTFAGDISESINFHRTKAALTQNLTAARELVEGAEEDCGKPQRSKTGGTTQGWHGVAPERVVQFLTSYRGHPAAHKCVTDLLARYIREENGADRLTEWCVHVATGSADRSVRLGPLNVTLVKRSWHLGSERDQTVLEANKTDLVSSDHFRIRRLVNPIDETADLSPKELNAALAATVREFESDPGGRDRPVRPAGQQIRHVRPESRGLLLLYPINASDDPAVKVTERIKHVDKVESDAQDLPLIGFAISFPHVADGRASTVAYEVNNVYWEQEFGTADEPEQAGE